MSIYISPNAYILERNGRSLVSFIIDIGLTPCTSGNLPDIEEKCCLGIIYFSMREADLLSLGCQIGYFHCHHMAVFVVIESGEDFSSINKIKEDLESKKLLIIDTDRMFIFLENSSNMIKLATNLLQIAKLDMRDSVRKKLRETIMENIGKIRVDSNNKDTSNDVSKEPAP
jgi:hypothetical protein